MNGMVGGVVPNHPASTLGYNLETLSTLRKTIEGDNLSKNESITATGKVIENEAAKRAEKLNDAAGQFEELFVSILMKQMRETLDEGLFGKEASDSFGAIFDLFMGKHLAESKPLGIGEAVKSYMKAEQTNEKE